MALTVLAMNRGLDARQSAQNIDASLGLDVDVPAGQDLFLTAGQIQLISNEDVYRGRFEEQWGLDQ